MRTTGALLEKGCHALEHGAWHDFTDRRVQNVILKWLLSDDVWLVHMGTPRTRWSRARTTGKHEPKGGMECASFTARLVRLCARLGVFFSIENPSSSELFAWPTLARALRKANAFSVPICSVPVWHTLYRKQTLIVTNLPTLARLEAPCCCRRHSEILQGRIRLPNGRWSWRTAFASAYPPRLCRAYAEAAALVAPPGARSRAVCHGIERRWERELAAAIGAADSPPAWRPRARRGTGSPGPAPHSSGAAVTSRRADGLRSRLQTDRKRKRETDVEAEERGDYLRRRSVRAPTRARYLAAASAVTEFARVRELKFESAKDVDIALELFTTELYFDGEAVQTGRVALYGYAWRAGLPTSGTAFPLAKQALKGWGSATPPQSRDPVPWAAVLLVAAQLLNMKNTAAVLAAALMTLNFDCYLRPAEGLGVSRSDVCTGSGSGVYAQRAIIIGQRAATDEPTKTGTFDDTIIVGEVASGRWWWTSSWRSTAAAREISSSSSG